MRGKRAKELKIIERKRAMRGEITLVQANENYKMAKKKYTNPHFGTHNIEPGISTTKFVVTPTGRKRLNKFGIPTDAL